MITFLCKLYCVFSFFFLIIIFKTFFNYCSLFKFFRQAHLMFLSLASWHAWQTFCRGMPRGILKHWSVCCVASKKCVFVLVYILLCAIFLPGINYSSVSDEFHSSKSQIIFSDWLFHVHTTTAGSLKGQKIPCDRQNHKPVLMYRCSLMTHCHHEHWWPLR